MREFSPRDLIINPEEEEKRDRKSPPSFSPTKSRNLANNKLIRKVRDRSCKGVPVAVCRMSRLGLSFRWSSNSAGGAYENNCVKPRTTFIPRGRKELRKSQKRGIRNEARRVTMARAPIG